MERVLEGWMQARHVSIKKPQKPDIPFIHFRGMMLAITIALMWGRGKVLIHR